MGHEPWTSVLKSSLLPPTRLNCTPLKDVIPEGQLQHQTTAEKSVLGCDTYDKLNVNLSAVCRNIKCQHVILILMTGLDRLHSSTVKLQDELLITSCLTHAFKPTNVYYLITVTKVRSFNRGNNMFLFLQMKCWMLTCSQWSVNRVWWLAVSANIFMAQ